MAGLGPQHRILVVNAGSSSLKLRALTEADRLAATVDLPAPGGEANPDVVGDAIARLAADSPIDAVGHRVVHGGTEFPGPVRLDAEVEARIAALTDLAPIHQPAALAGIAAIGRALPDVPAVACFDTAFHGTIPEPAATYAVPLEWRTRWPIRRFGFHGLSHAYVARRSASLLGRPGESLRIVSCHLGAGASLAAIEGGRSIDTTMGFTPLEGLVMATRSGSVDPGLVLWLATRAGLTPETLIDALEHRSGLLGLAGSDDMAAVLEAEADGDPHASLAIEVYLHRLRGGIAAMVASLGGLDALVFTGGVGERAASIRARAADGLGFLGIEVDPSANDTPRGDAPDREVGTPGTRVRTLVITAREDLEIARQVRGVLADDEPTYRSGMDDRSGR